MTSFRPIALALGAAATGWCALHWMPSLELAVFARGAAQLAGVLTGSPVLPRDAGWLLPAAPEPIAVTAACSATDFFLMLAALLGWQLARTRLPALPALVAAVVVALPLTLFVNALRLVAVAAAHRWFIPLLPATYSAFLHLLVGAAGFLPALVACNLALEFHARHRPTPRT